METRYGYCAFAATRCCTGGCREALGRLCSASRTKGSRCAPHLVYEPSARCCRGCGSGSSCGRCPSLADYVTGIEATGGAIAAGRVLELTTLKVQVQLSPQTFSPGCSSRPSWSS